MALLVELQVVPNRILQLVKARILANRARFQQEQDKAKTVSLRPRPQRARFGARSDTYRRPEPAATGALGPGYFLTIAGWWYGRRSFGQAPPEWMTQGVQWIKPVRVYVRGKDSTSTLDLFSYAAIEAVADLLNGVTPDDVEGFALLSGDEAIVGEPYRASLSSYRRSTPVNATGASEYTASNYTFYSFRQPPCHGTQEPGTHLKYYYNVYEEEQAQSELSHAFQSTHMYGRQTPPVYRELDFLGNDKPLTDVHHVHAVAAYMYGFKVVYPFLGNGDIHLFVDYKHTKNGISTISSAGQSLFGVGHVVWLYLSYHVSAFGHAEKRYHVHQVETGTFSYTTDAEGGTASHSGTRLVLRPVVSGGGLSAYGVDYYGVVTHVYADLAAVEADVNGPKTYAFWDDRYGLTTAYSKWIKTNTNGGVLAPPQPSGGAMGFIGSSDIYGASVECSKAGKAYVVYQIARWADDPVYSPDVSSPHDLSGEITVHRPYSFPGDPKTRRQSYLRLKFLEIDCKTNSVLKEEGPVEVEMDDQEDANKATWQNLPNWFPSKRYRDAGWEGGQLNLDASERYHTVVITENGRPILQRWLLPQSQGIAAVVAELQVPTLTPQLQPIPEVNAESIAWSVGNLFDPRNPPKPDRYSYNYSGSYYVAE